MKSIKWKINKNFTYSLIKENILSLYVEAIVNPANSSLKHGGGLAKLIKDEAGGEKFQRESDDYIKKYGEVKPGSCCVTSKGNLNSIYIKHVIHAVGPIWRSGKENEPQILKSAFESVLEEAGKLKIQSVAIPPISTGIYNFPKDLAAEIFYECINDFAKKNKFYPIQVVMSIFDDPTFSVFYKKHVEFIKTNKDSLENIIM